MKISHRLLLNSLTIALATGAQSAPAVQFDPAVTATTTRHIIVKFKPTAKRAPDLPVRAEALQRVAKGIGVELSHFRPMSGAADVVALPTRVSYAEAAAIAARIAAQPDVLYAVPDELDQPTVAPNDPQLDRMWHYYAGGGVGINLDRAWGIAGGGSPNVVIAVLDSGSRPHVDLVANLLPGYDMISDPARGGDGDGRDADASDTGDFLTAAEAEAIGGRVRNSSWHGLHVGGTIGAVGNNGVGITGVAYNTRQFHVRVLGKGGGTISDIADGMRWAVGLPVPDVPPNPTPSRILNMSLGGTNPCGDVYQDAVNAVLATGALIVMAAGNSNIDVARARPANCSGDFLRVAASDFVGGKATYSNFSEGIVPIDITAPGGTGAGDENGEPDRTDRVLSTYNAGDTVPTTDNYEFSNGTSMATPHVAGVAALMLSTNPNLTGAQMANIIRTTAKPFNTPATGIPCTVGVCGPGMLDANAAVRGALAAGGSISPQTGWWWNPAESGRGFFIERQGNNVFMAGYLYEVDGRATWFTAFGAMTGSSFSGEMNTATGGQTLTGPFRPNTAGPSLGRLSVTFTSPTEATMTWPGGTVPLARFRFGQGESDGFDSGWWWSTAEPGRGYSIELQGSSVFMVGFMYDDAGAATWYLASGTGSEAGFSSNWAQVANGQSLTGAYRAPTVTNANVGAVTVPPSTSVTRRTLTMPDGRAITLTRFPFR